MRHLPSFFAMTLVCICTLGVRPVGAAEPAPPPPVTQPEPPLVAALDEQPDFLCATADGGFVFASGKKFGRWGKDKVAWQADREMKAKAGDTEALFREISCDAKGDRVLAFAGNRLVVYDGKAGKILVDRTRTKESQVEYEHALMMPTGDILLIEKSTEFAPCAVVKDGMLKKELHRFKVDPYLDEWSISPDGGRISYIGSPIRTDEQEETICVRNIKTDTDALLHGKHFNMPKDFNGFRTMSIGPVFYDGILHDGKRYLLLSRSGGCWNHATVFLFDWKKKDPVLLKGGLMTANFARNRFAVCTRDNRLDIYDLAGKSFHAVERLPGERTACMSFAPDGKTLLIGDDKGKIRRVTLPK